MSTTAPRATLTSSAPSFIAARNDASTRPRVSSVSGSTSTTTSAVGSSSASSAIACTPSRADRATRTTEHSNGASRASTAAPIAPYPTSSTVLSASAGCQPGVHSCRSWARTNAGTPRSDERTSVSTSSAVEVSWMPRPLHSVTSGGIADRMLSTPAVRVWT